MARWERELVGSVPAEALDTKARERVGSLLRSARQDRPCKPAAGTVVEFLHGGTLKCGFLRFTPIARKGVLIVDLDGQERRLRSGRVLHHGAEQVAVQPVERGLAQLRPIDDRRRKVASRIDLVTLRELAIEAAGQTQPWSARDLAGIHDSTDRPTSLQQAAMLRALFKGQEFRRVADHWVVRSSSALQGARDARCRDESRRRLVALQADWLQRLAAGEPHAPVPPDAEALLHDLAAYVLTSPDDDPGEVVDVVHAAHLHGRAAVRDLLVRIGHWDADENLVLHREKIPQVFSPAAQQQAATLAICQPMWRGWPAWGQSNIGIADPVDPQVCLRAWSIRRRRRGWRLRVHVALPALWLQEGGALLDEMVDRGVRIDLPDQSLPLIPDQLLLACSFSTTQNRPALTITTDLDESGRLVKARLRRSRVRLHGLLPATTPTGHTPVLDAAAELAQRMRQVRQAAGAWEFLGGERTVRALQGVAAGGRIGVEDAAAIDREMRFVGEQGIADICEAAGVGAIHRTRLRPSTSSTTDPASVLRIEGGSGRLLQSASDAFFSTSTQGFDPLYVRWQMEGHSAAESLQLARADHAGTGTGPRALGLAPDDSYAEFMMQRQLLALVGHGDRLGTDQLEDWLPGHRACHEVAAAAIRAGRRHWCLRWLAAHQQQRLPVWVAARRGAGYLVLFDELPMSAWVPSGGEMVAQAGDRLSVAVERVNIRGDELLLTGPRLETPA